MNHKEVTQKWKGKNYIEPGMKTAECVAYAKLYCKERGYPIRGFGGSAISGWNTGNPFDSTWVRITPTSFNYPEEGDIIFWSEARCKYGHVAVANKFCNPTLLRYTDQNGTGKYDVIQSRWATYKNVLGWFHRIG